MKNIKELVDCSYDIPIMGIVDDSRLVEEGFLFVATKGFNVDHYDYIEDAIHNGCRFVICDREISYDIPHLVVSNINSLFVDLCRKFYDVSMDSFSFIGITGTDGKTTTTTIVKNILDDCAYIGTNGVEIADKNFGTSNTTPCISELYQDLRTIQDNHIHKVSMEVSSEALLHDRVNGFLFDVIGFTNVTGDHLNVHKTFDEYVKCKMKLLNFVKKDGYVVYNGDDSNLQNISSSNAISFGFSRDNQYIIDNVKYEKRCTHIHLICGEESWDILSPLVGTYNVYNVVMAFIIGRLYLIDDSILIERISKLCPIKGRCEFLDFGQKYDVVLDYAHTINGIRSILENFQDYETVIVVTGSAGGREVQKRSVIGDLVLRLSDIAIFTMDDPREEDPDDIIDQMVGDSKDYYRIVDREDAISFALSIAPVDSVVLILGKGRDNYMAIGDKKIHYNDYDVIYHYFH